MAGSLRGCQEAVLGLELETYLREGMGGFKTLC